MNKILISLFLVLTSAMLVSAGTCTFDSYSLCWNMENDGADAAYEHLCVTGVEGDYYTADGSCPSSYCSFKIGDEDITCPDEDSGSSGSSGRSRSCPIVEECDEIGPCVDSVATTQCREIRKCPVNEFLIKEYETTAACEVTQTPTEPESGTGTTETPVLADGTNTGGEEPAEENEGNLLTGNVVADDEEDGNLLSGNSIFDTLGENGKKISWSLITLIIIGLAGIVIFNYAKAGKKYE